MSFKKENFAQPATPEKKEFYLDKGNAHKVFEKTCSECGGNFSIFVLNRAPNFEFVYKDGSKISAKQMEEQAKAQKLCPPCEEQKNKTEQ